MPLVQQPYVIEGSTVLTDWNSALDVYARLRPGVSAKAPQQETLALAASLHELQPERVQAGEYLEAHPILQFETDSPEFQIVVTAVALVLLLLVAACANLGTLVLARGVTREREIRIRMALGAGADAGGAPAIHRIAHAGAPLRPCAAWLLSTGILKWIQLQHNPDDQHPAGLASARGHFRRCRLLAALVFGLPPALRLTSLVPRAGRARTVFLAAQVAVSCLLLIVSGLLVGRPRTARPQRSGLRLPPSRLGLARPESPRLWRSPPRRRTSTRYARALPVPGRGGGVRRSGWRRGATRTWGPRGRGASSRAIAWTRNFWTRWACAWCAAATSCRVKKGWR